MNKRSNATKTSSLKIQKRARSEFECHIQIFKEAVLYFEGISKNISLNGLYVQSEKKLEINTPCVLKLKLEARENPFVIEIEAHVVRVDDKGMALNFDRMDSDSFEHLKKLVIYNSKNPEEVTAQCKRNSGFK